ncbi:non-SMC condensin I complex subunit H [Cochliomyia hominivorax]
MTPAHTDSPLRRSEVGIFREGQQNVTINDDEEERRQARRRTLLAGQNTGESSTFEENETLKKCLEIYNGNKLSKENAWSLSLIDTLSTLLERHHKSLNNFKVAGSSLEASSKVYSLRVDSIHSDVLRMSAGLNAQKFKEKSLDEDDDDEDNEAENRVATGGDGSNDPNASAAGLEGNEKQKPKAKKQRKNLSTVTKNKDTLNARLDTVPLQDPVFGKLNSIVGSINSSNRLMNNILLTTDSELRLRTTFLIWDAQQLPSCDYTEEVDLHTENEAELAPCDRLFKMRRPEDIKLRPLHGGYVISDTPQEKDDDDEKRSRLNSINSDFDDGPPGCDDMGGGGGGGGDLYDLAPFANANEVVGMAFDINAECEPMPVLSEQIPIMDVNYEELDDLTTEERTAINNCRGLRKAPILIEDLRPVDASSKLEYSYRPLDKISQFWAGPSHWKFKRARTVRSSLHVQQTDATAGRPLNQRTKRAKKAIDKNKSKQLKFGEFHDELFIKYDDKYKSRKANIQKKWDQRKLKLPVDMQIDTERFFFYTLAPGIPVHIKGLENTNPNTLCAANEETLQNNMAMDDDHHDFGGGCDDGDMMHQEDNMPLNETNHGRNMTNVPGMEVDGDNANNFAPNEGNGNDTILEIATDFEGAPSQVTKIVVPFAKRAKVIDMKNLKRSCTVLLTKQLKRPIAIPEELPKHPIPKQEEYQDGVASFHEVYEHLPELLTQSMTEALSTSIAFYSVLHLANEHNLRLIPQEDLKDFKIRKVA